MGKYNTPMVLMTLMSIVMLFASLVFSALAADEAKKGNTGKSYHYSLWSSLISGLSVVVTVAGLIIYLMRPHHQVVISSGNTQTPSVPSHYTYPAGQQ